MRLHLSPRVWASVTVALVVMAVTNAATVAQQVPRQCETPTTHPVVAHGHSAAGQLWQIIPCRAGNVVTLEMHIPEMSTDAGGAVAFGFPNRRFAVEGSTGSDVGATHEQILYAITLADVARVKFILTAGPPITLPTAFAPVSARARFPYLRHFRFVGDMYSPLRRGPVFKACPITTSGRHLRCVRFAD